MSEGNKEKGLRTSEKKRVHPVVKIGSAIAVLVLGGYAFSEKKGWVPPIIGPTIDKIAQMVFGMGLPEGCFAEGGIEVPLEKGEYFTLTAANKDEGEYNYNLYWDGEYLSGENWGKSQLSRGESVQTGTTITKGGDAVYDWTIIRCGEKQGKDTFMVWRTEELKRAAPEPTPTPTQLPVKVIP